MKKLIALLMLLAMPAHAQFIDGFNYTQGTSGSSGGSGVTTSPGGVSGSVQFNGGGSFAGNTAFTYDGQTAFFTSNTAISVNPSSTAGTYRGMIWNGGNGRIEFDGNNMGVGAGGGRGVRLLVNGNSLANPLVNATSAGTVGIGLMATTPSATLHISGTSIVGICNASITCGAPQNGAACYSTARATLALCNGAGSWIPLVSTTIVSASGL